VINKNGPVGNLTFRPGQPPPDLTRSDHVDRTDQQPQQPTPVTDDAHATAPQLHACANLDYTTAQDRRDQLSGEDRVHGNETGGQS
jgi:hypothetical protein